MGVHGLLSYLKRHPQARERRVYLKELADAVKDKSRGGTPKLLCDFFSILYWLLSEFHEAKVKCKDYQPFSYIYGGDIVDYEERFLAFVRALRHLGIEPVFVVDGERGSNLTGFRAKLETHKGRQRGKMGRVFHCNLITKYYPTEEVESYSCWFPHPLVPLHMMMALKSEGVTLEHCIGEADAHLAKHAQSGAEDICGVLTNDTDMIMMRNCDVFLCQFFDRKLALGIRNVRFNCKPSEVVCEKLTPSKLAEVLDLPEADLKNLSIICGNDYTDGLNKKWELHKKMNLSKPIVESAAKWLRETPHSELHKTPPFDEIDKSSKGKYLKAIQYTYEAYSGTAPVHSLDLSSRHHRRRARDDCDSQSSPSSSFYETILAGVKEGRMTRELLSIAANSIHWRTGVVEIIEQDEVGKLPSEAPLCIDDLLLSIRRIIYKLLSLEMITEYGRTRGYPCKKIQIKVRKRSIDLLHNLVSRTEVERVCLLTTFLSKAYTVSLNDVSLDELCVFPTMQTQFDRMIVAKLLLKPLILCSSLLFSYDLRGTSTSFSLDHTPDIFLVTCFMCILRKPPKRVLSRPSPEAVDVATGFACIIEHAYHLASLLGLFELMPLPAQMYQSAALVPFFHIATCKPATIKHQLRVSKEMAETHSSYGYVTKLCSFKKLKGLVEEVYHTSKFCLELISSHTAFRLAIAFLEVTADIDEADKRNELFVQESSTTVPCSSHKRKHSKGKSMLTLVAIHS